MEASKPIDSLLQAYAEGKLVVLFDDSPKAKGTFAKRLGTPRRRV